MSPKDYQEITKNILTLEWGKAEGQRMATGVFIYVKPIVYLLRKTKKMVREESQQGSVDDSRNKTVADDFRWTGERIIL